MHSLIIRRQAQAGSSVVCVDGVGVRNPDPDGLLSSCMDALAAAGHI